ncbi:uncharacterized protein TNCV_1560971 [Trichonephila clavipes]|nr:uncharacterized protein TNCV_1560971 [Trichonephila clavipes]
MPLRRFRRQYEQLSQFERERIIGIREARWSARLVARQSGRSDCVMRRRWANCIINRHLGIGSTFSRDPVPSRTIRRHLAERHLGSWRPLLVLSSDESRFNLSTVMTIKFVCGDPVMKPSILPLLYSDILLRQLV